MPIIYQPWRAALLPASLGGAGFHVEVGSQAGGRRNVPHEYPKRDTPYTEDMGRRARRWPVTGYVIGPFYIADRDALIAACEAEGAQTLVHPSLGELQVVCDTYEMTETRERGGIATFQMLFVEAGEDPNGSAGDDTQAQAGSAADASNGASAGTLDAGLRGSGTGGGIGGISSDYSPSYGGSVGPGGLLGHV